MEKKEVHYRDLGGNDVRLTKDAVLKLIRAEVTVSEREILEFMDVCKYLRLNPFLKEIHFIKRKGERATYAVSFEALLKRAESDENFDGFEVKTEGRFPNLTATATVYRKDVSHPFRVVVHYEEVVRKVKNPETQKEEPAGYWKTMPRWMLRKVALARALREAFPGVSGTSGSDVTYLRFGRVSDGTASKGICSVKPRFGEPLYSEGAERKNGEIPS